MIRGTTPTHTFKVPSDINIKSARVLYSQRDKIVFTKETKDCDIDGNTIIVRLSQEDTLSFDCKNMVEIQVRVLTESGDSLVSDIKSVSVGRCLDKDVIV